MKDHEKVRDVQSSIAHKPFQEKSPALMSVHQSPCPEVTQSPGRHDEFVRGKTDALSFDMVRLATDLDAPEMLRNSPPSPWQVAADFAAIDDALLCLLYEEGSPSALLDDLYHRLCWSLLRTPTVDYSNVYSKNHISLQGTPTPTTLMVVAGQVYIASPEPTADRYMSMETYLAVMWENQATSALSLVRTSPWWPRMGQSVQHGAFSIATLSEERIALFGLAPNSLSQLYSVGDDALSDSLQMKLDEKTTMMRMLRVSLCHGQDSREINVGIFTKWPDGCPLHGQTLDGLQQAMRKVDPTGLLMVNCAAGVGRTGTFILLDALRHQTNEVQSEPYAFLMQTWTQMRLQRPFMVQTYPQFISILAAQAPRLQQLC